MTKIKVWFNKKFPQYRLCINKWWCLRAHTYDHECYKHQLSAEQYPELFTRTPQNFIGEDEINEMFSCAPNWKRKEDGSWEPE